MVNQDNITADTDLGEALQQERIVDRRLILKATLTAFIVGGALLCAGKLVEMTERHWSLLSYSLMEVGKVVVVTSVVGLIFEFMIHQRFSARVQGAVSSVKEQVRRLDKSIEDLQRTVYVTSGAIESGLGAVYGERQLAIDKIGAILRETEPEENEELRLLGISLGDFLCPHGRLYGATVEALKRGVNVKALIVDLDSPAAMTRAEREEKRDAPRSGDPQFEKWYHTTRCYNELKTATDAAREYSTVYRGGGGNSEDIKGKFQFRVYSLTPVCFLAIHKNTMFLESYHYAGRGGEAPILQIDRSTSAASKDASRLFRIYSDHFQVLWEISKDGPAPVFFPSADADGAGLLAQRQSTASTEG